MIFGHNALQGLATRMKSQFHDDDDNYNKEYNDNEKGGGGGGWRLATRMKRQEVKYFEKEVSDILEDGYEVVLVMRVVVKKRMKSGVDEENDDTDNNDCRVTSGVLFKVRNTYFHEFSMVIERLRGRYCDI